MAELTPQERLQPSLLDRLTDDHPQRDVESRNERVLSLAKLRQCVLRDIQWLLSTGNLAAVHDLDHYPEAAHSVINFGLPDLAGRAASSIDTLTLERALRQAIADFEPRIRRNTVKVQVRVDPASMSHNTLSFDIEGEMWAQPTPLQLYMRTEIDLETGDVRVIDNPA
jgi:type VI secretion system protein ImpF